MSFAKNFRVFLVAEILQTFLVAKMFSFVESVLMNFYIIDVNKTLVATVPEVPDLKREVS